MKPGRVQLCITMLILALTLSAPMITESVKYCPRDSKGHIDFFGIASVKDIYFFYLRLGITGIILFLNFVQQYVQVIRPFARIDELRRASFDEVIRPAFERIGRSVFRQARLSIMQKTTWFRLGSSIYFCTLRIIYDSGFSNQDLDRHLRFIVIRIFGYTYCQGVCGFTLAHEAVTCINPGKGSKIGYTMTQRQKDKTKGISYIISIPIIKHSAGGGSCRITGVMNVDTRMRQPAEYLDKNEDVLKECSRQLDSLGRYAALWL